MIPATRVHPTRVGRATHYPTDEVTRADRNRSRAVKALEIALDLVLIGAVVSVLWWAMASPIG